MLNGFRISTFIAIALFVSSCGQHKAMPFLDGEEEPPFDTTQPSLPLPELVASPEMGLLKKYSYVDPEHMIPKGLLKEALQIYDGNSKLFPNREVISIVDFAQFSGNKRFYIVNMKKGSVWALRTAHGKGSDMDYDGYADQFSNVPGSNATSLGVYRTAETYYGQHGYSLRLDGLSPTNSNARPRAIVVHGASYVREADVIQGRSWGCPAVAEEHYQEVIDLIKDGSMIYAGVSNELRLP